MEDAGAGTGDGLWGKPGRALAHWSFLLKPSLYLQPVPASGVTVL